MKALVTGATGHLGNVLVKTLVSEKVEVSALVLPGDSLEPLEGLEVRIIRGDLRNLEEVKAAAIDNDIVFHLAGYISILPGQKKTLNEVNVKGTKNILLACEELKIKRLIYTSTVHVYEEPPEGSFITEECDINPDKVVGEYAKSKATATLEVKKAINKGMDVIIAYPSGIIGPFDYKGSEINQVIKMYMKRMIKLYIEGAYDFVDVRDVARGLYELAKQGESGEDYIISGERITIKEIFNYLEEFTGIKSPKIKVATFLAKIVVPFATLWYKTTRLKPLFTSYSLYTLTSNSYISSKKFRNIIKYPFRSARETIKDTVNWLRSSNFAKSQ